MPSCSVPSPYLDSITGKDDKGGSQSNVSVCKGERSEELIEYN